MSTESRITTQERHPGLDDLVERLRTAGFRIGPSEILDAARLLRHLAEAGEDLAGREALRAKLRPLLCKSSEEQQDFDQLFSAWAEQPPQVDSKAGREPTPTTKSTARKDGKPSSRHWLYWILVAGFILLVLILIWQQPPTPLPDQIKPPAENADTAPIGRQATPTAPSPEADKKPLEPLFPETPQQPEVQLGVQEVNGFYPGLRYTETIRTAWLWSLLTAPLLGLLLLTLVRPRRVLTRGRGGQVRLEGWPRATTARLAVARLEPAVVGRLDRHLRGPANELVRSARRPRVDVTASVRATIRRLGVPTLRYQHTRLRPSYLVLVDAEHEEDLAVLWAERLRTEGIAVQLYRLERNEGEPTHWRSVAEQGLRRLPLDALPRPDYGQRLMFVGDGDALLDAQGDWTDWARRLQFRRWPDRALFTPVEPRQWGAREETLGDPETLSDPGFLVLPQDDNALAAWADLLVTGELREITLSEPQRYPPLLAQNRDRFLEDTAPPEEELLQLIRELKAYLGENGYYWLSTCAVPPLIDHRLTLLLGSEFLQRSGAQERRLPYHLARSYRLLARLPWLALGHMPDWLRLALLASLPERIQDEVRRAVEGLLAPQRLSLKGELYLALEPPRRTAPDHYEEKRPKRRQDEKESDGLYLGFMDGISAQQLNLRMPNQWRKWVGAVSRPGTRWRRFRAWLSAGIARFWYRQGLAHLGPGRGRLLFSTGLVFLSVGLLTSAAAFPPSQWEETTRASLFSEEVRGLDYPHQEAVSVAAFSPDGSRVVTASADGTARLWEAATGRPLGMPMRHDEAVIHAAFSADGSRVVTASEDATARLWEAASSQPLGAPMRHDKAVTHAAFSPDGSRLVTSSEDGTARLWEADSGQPLGSPMRHESAVIHATFSPDGNRVVTASEDHTARLWEADSGQTLGTPMRHDDRVFHAAFSHDGRRIVTASWDKTARQWDANNGKPLGTPLRHDGAVFHAAFSPDDQMLVTASWDKTARLWEADSGQPLGAPLRHENAVFQASFSPDGLQVLSASFDGTARLWEAASGQPLGPPLRHDEAVLHAAFSPDGRKVVTASQDGKARFWVAQSSQPLGARMSHGSPVTVAAFSPDGRRVVTASFDNTARLWEANSGQPRGTPMRHQDWVNDAAFSPDGRLVVTASQDGTARLWDAASGQPTGPILKHDEAVFHTAFSPDGQRVVTASKDKTARLWDANTGQLLAPPLTHESMVVRANFSPDGQRVVTASHDHTARLWDANTGQLLAAVRHDSQVTYAAFSPDGQRVVTTSQDRTARLWNADTGQLLAGPMRHEAVVVHAAFSPDGHLLVTASYDNTARLWNADNGQPLGAPMRHDFWVNYADFSPDSRRVVTAGRDGMVQIWDAYSGKPLGEPLRFQGSVNRAVFSAQGNQILAAVGGSISQLPESGTPTSAVPDNGDLKNAAPAADNESRLQTPSPPVLSIGSPDTGATSSTSPAESEPTNAAPTASDESKPQTPSPPVLSIGSPDTGATSSTSPADREPVNAPPVIENPSNRSPPNQPDSVAPIRRGYPQEQPPRMPPSPPQDLSPPADNSSWLRDAFISSAHAAIPEQEQPQNVVRDGFSTRSDLGSENQGERQQDQPTERPAALAGKTAGFAQVFLVPSPKVGISSQAWGAESATVVVNSFYRAHLFLFSGLMVLLGLVWGFLSFLRLRYRIASAADAGTGS